MSQHMSKPREEVVHILKRCVRHFKKFPVMATLVPGEVSDDEHDLVAWTGSDWARDLNARRSTSGGPTTYSGPVHHLYSLANLDVEF